MASGPDFLQMIFKVKKGKRFHYRRSKLVECEVIKDWEAADRFRSEVLAELTRSGLDLQVPEIHGNYSEGRNKDEDSKIHDPVHPDSFLPTKRYFILILKF